jgi:hypothetical protein
VDINATLLARILKAIQSVSKRMLACAWTKLNYRLYVLGATKGTLNEMA